MCPHNPAGSCEDCEHDRVVSALRDAIQRQVDTTPCGKRLIDLSPHDVKDLVDNLVGNLYYVVLELKKS